MAKSKFPKKIIGIGTGVGVTAVLVWLFVLPIILVAPNIAPEQPMGGFEIPIPEPIPPNLPPINPDATACEEESTDPECVEDVIPPEEIPIDENPPPITSDDPPIEQICDEDPENALCVVIEPILPDPETIETDVTLFGFVTKTDSDSVSSVVETTLDIPLQSLFIDPEDANRDFESGSLDIRVLGNTSSVDLSLTGSAEFDILIANQSIFSQPIPVSINKAPNSGQLATSFELPTGEIANGFTFLFADHLDKFPAIGSTELQINLNNIEITVDSRETFASSELNLLTMTIDTDPDLVLITNEEGGIERVLPTDVAFNYHNLGSYSLKSGGGCGGYHTRHSGTIEIFDAENNLIKSAILRVGDTYGHLCGRNYNVLQTTLDRETTYRLVHTGLDTDKTADFDITFETPRSQKIYSLKCYHGTASAGLGLAWYYCEYPSADGTEIMFAPPPLS